MQVIGFNLNQIKCFLLHAVNNRRIYFQLDATASTAVASFVLNNKDNDTKQLHSPFVSTYSTKQEFKFLVW